MLPRLPLELPFDISLHLPSTLPSLPTSPLEAPEALTGGSAWTWVLAGGVLAVIFLWALRRARRMAITAALAVTGLVAAWNAGFLPLSA